MHTDVVTVEIELADPPADAIDAYLRLHLLSHRLVRPHGVNLDGVFGLLTNVVWTSAGPCAVDGFEEVRLRLRADGPVQVFGVDKFPRMVDYVLPAGVRIADADRVRLGAHLAEGTTVMHEGFVNYNAGTLGTSMVEGRISAGVVVGDGSDVGGGASIMGTLSGGGTEVISIGERCLIGANAGIGISLGDDCVVEAGCYVTAGTKVTIKDIDCKPKVVKAAELSGADNVLFRRNSVTGTVEAVPWERGRRPQRGPAQRTDDDAACGSATWSSSSSSPWWWASGVAMWRGSVRCPTPRAARRRSTAHRVDLTTEQAGNATLIAAVGVRRALPARAVSIALATAFQESKLRNLDHGDRDSLGHLPAAAVAGLGQRSRCGTRTTPPTRSTTRWPRSTASRRCGSPRPPRRCSAPATPRPTSRTRPTPGRWPRR